MSRYYQLFKTKDERDKWEREHSQYRICMRMTAQELKEELPSIDIADFEFCTIWTNDF